MTRTFVCWKRRWARACGRWELRRTKARSRNMSCSLHVVQLSFGIFLAALRKLLCIALHLSLPMGAQESDLSALPSTHKWTWLPAHHHTCLAVNQSSMPAHECRTQPDLGACSTSPLPGPKLRLAHHAPCLLPVTPPTLRSQQSSGRQRVRRSLCGAGVGTPACLPLTVCHGAAAATQTILGAAP